MVNWALTLPSEDIIEGSSWSDSIFVVMSHSSSNGRRNPFNTKKNLNENDNWILCAWVKNVIFHSLLWLFWLNATGLWCIWEFYIFELKSQIIFDCVAKISLCDFGNNTNNSIDTNSEWCPPKLMWTTNCGESGNGGCCQNVIIVLKRELGK